MENFHDTGIRDPDRFFLDPVPVKKNSGSGLSWEVVIIEHFLVFFGLQLVRSIVDPHDGLVLRRHKLCTIKKY